jgi:hypothetical protein
MSSGEGHHDWREVVERRSTQARIQQHLLRGSQLLGLGMIRSSIGGYLV